MGRRSRAGRKVFVRLSEGSIAELDRRAEERNTDRGQEAERAIQAGLQETGKEPS